MLAKRHLEWSGTWNTRDLGGLVLDSGGSVRWASLVRSGSLNHLDEQGWEQLVGHGVRTVVDLRNREQADAEPQLPPAEVETIRCPLEQGLEADPEFRSWMESGWFATPLYFDRFLQRWPDRCAEAVAAVADASPGCVLVHCGKGSDRAGLVVAVILCLVGVRVDEIVADYELTAQRLQGPRAHSVGMRDDSKQIAQILEQANLTVNASLRSFVDQDRLERLMLSNGLSATQVHDLRRRLTAS